MKTAIAAALALTVGFAADAFAEGDPAKGKRVFAKCMACHDVGNERNKVGPHLVGIFGRTAGAVDGFKYSNAMANSGVVWSEETIAAYVMDPKGFIEGNRMAFAGLKKDEDVANLLAYLQQETGS